MNVREATPGDEEAIRRVHRASIEGLGPSAYDEDQVAAWARGTDSADYAAVVEADDTVFLVGELEGSIRGFGTLRLATPADYEMAPDAEVTGVYVHPEAARQGLGTRIYSELEGRARSNGVDTLGLRASLNAVDFYVDHGYRRVEEHSHEFSAHESTGVTGTVVEMVKELRVRERGD